jgi:hypothetical protein
LETFDKSKVLNSKSVSKSIKKEISERLKSTILVSKLNQKEIEK